jgi:hypothetical protein
VYIGFDLWFVCGFVSLCVVLKWRVHVCVSVLAHVRVCKRVNN